MWRRSRAVHARGEYHNLITGACLSFKGLPLPLNNPSIPLPSLQLFCSTQYHACSSFLLLLTAAPWCTTHILLPTRSLRANRGGRLVHRVDHACVVHPCILLALPLGLTTDSHLKQAVVYRTHSGVRFWAVLCITPCSRSLLSSGKCST